MTAPGRKAKPCMLGDKGSEQKILQPLQHLCEDHANNLQNSKPANTEYTPARSYFEHLRLYGRKIRNCIIGYC